MDPLVSTIISVIIESGINTFQGLFGKAKLFLLQRRLENAFSSKILKKYGDETYYNDFDSFLTKNRVINRIFTDLINSSSSGYTSQSYIIKYYIQLFIEQYPEFKSNHTEMRAIIRDYFGIVLNELLRIKVDNADSIILILKVFLSEFSFQSSERSERVEKKLDLLLKANEGESVPDIFFRNRYCNYLNSLYPKYSRKEYLNRKIYEKTDQNAEYGVLETLIKEKKVLLLGEAGFGKTYESIILLHSVLDDERCNEIVPVYFSLQEYGLLYFDIMEGVQRKFNGFYSGNIERLINELLQNGKLLFIFDGVDDITEEMQRTKFISDVNEFELRYNNNLFLYTSRINRYRGEFGEQKQYFLTRLDEETIQQQLREEGINTIIPNDYVQLFSNPFFLYIGKTILKKNRSRDVFNRSHLMCELFCQMYGGLDQKKGLSPIKPTTYSEVIMILGKYAYESFYRPFMNYIEFDDKLSRIISTNKEQVIQSIVNSGILNLTESVQFTHKLLKEYCAAYYLVNTFPLSNNTDLYLDLIQKNEWKEVFIFAGGIYNEMDTQDEFFDFVMGNNFPLYIECVNAKADLSSAYGLSKQDSCRRILTQLLNSYRYIVNNYLCPISGLFEPLYSNRVMDKKIGITGCLSEDNDFLSYWFDFVKYEEGEISLVTEQQLATKRDEFTKKAILEGRNVSFYSVNLNLSGLNVDSGRKIALNNIKKKLKQIIEKKQLIESEYLLCERVLGVKQRLEIIRESSSLVDMQAKVSELISNTLSTTKNENVRFINYNGVEILPLNDLLCLLNCREVKFEDCILPGPDRTPSENEPHYVWDFYSKQQKEKRVSLYFFYHQISYLSMVEYNFPEICQYFSRYQDSPYQNVVILDYRQKEGMSEHLPLPLLTYYYVAAQGNNVPMPMLHEVNEMAGDTPTHESIIKEIIDSYYKSAKKIHHIGYSRAVFTITIYSKQISPNTPLSDYVYKSIKNGLEEVFGSL